MAGVPPYGYFVPRKGSSQPLCSHQRDPDSHYALPKRGSQEPDHRYFFFVVLHFGEVGVDYLCVVAGLAASG